MRPQRCPTHSLDNAPRYITYEWGLTYPHRVERCSCRPLCAEQAILSSAGLQPAAAQACNLHRKDDRHRCNCPCVAEKTQRLFLLAAGNTPRFPLPHTCRQRDYTRSSDSRTAGECKIMPWPCVSGQTIMKKIAGGASAQSLNACITAGAVSEGPPPGTLAPAKVAESHADASEPSGWRLVPEAGVGGVLLLGPYPVGNKAP